MATRKVFGTIHDSRDLPWANQRVTFVLRVGSFTASTQYPRKRVEATTNAAGYFEVDLWANSDGLLPTTYQCKLPDADEFEFRLSNGATAVNLSELRGLGGISTQAPQTLLQQLEPYFLSQSEGDGRYRKLTDTIAFGDLSGGLADGQIPVSIARVDDVTTRIAQHAAASDPHPQYLTPGEGALLFAAAGTPSATNLSVAARTATTLTIVSDTGQDAIVPAASATEAGLLTAADKAKIDTALQPGGAATPAQGAKADTALQPASSLDATKLAGIVPIGSMPSAVATDAEVAAAIAGVTTSSIGADIAGPKTLTPNPADPGDSATNSAFLSWLIAAMRGAQATLGGLGALASKSTIADADVATGAAIAWSKISKSGAGPGDIGAATAAQGAKADTALQPASNLDAAKLTGTVPIGSIPAAVATDAEVAAAIAGVTTSSIGADIAGPKTLTPSPADPGNSATNSAFLSWLIAAMRGAQATLGGLGALASKSTIADADVATGAAIAWSKISKSGAGPGDIGAATAAQGAKADTALQPASNLDATKLAGIVPIGSIPAAVATDAEVAAAIAGVTTTSIGAIPTSEKGAVNGIASLVGGKVPAAQSRGCSVNFTAATGTWDFVWPDGSTQSVDTVMESLFQGVNYSSATKTITFTRSNGSTLDVPIADLVDLPEIFIATQNPVATPTTGQKLYLRSDTGEYWIKSGAAWAGPFLSITAAERSKLAGIASGAQVNAVNSVAGKTGTVVLVKGDVGLGAVDNTADADKPISSATATALNNREPTAARALTPTGTDPGNSATINGFLSWLISAARSAQTTLSGLGSLAFKSTIASADITDGTIVDADISPAAAIAISKVSGLQTAINSKQPTDPTLQSIADSTATGLIRRDANETVTLLPTGAMAAPLLAATDAAAVRGIAGLGALATKNLASLNADVTGDSYLTTSSTLTLGQLGGPLGSAKLILANQGGLNGAQFETSIPLVDFVFRGLPGLGYPAGGVANLRLEYRPDAVQLPGNTREFQIFFDTDPYNATYFAVGNNEARIQPRLTLNNGWRINNAPAITWHNSAIVPANGAVQDYTLTGLALNDFCQCSTGKPAQAVDIGGGVIRLRTDTTGFTGNIKIFAIRTN